MANQSTTKSQRSIMKMTLRRSTMSHPKSTTNRKKNTMNNHNNMNRNNSIMSNNNSTMNSQKNIMNNQNNNNSNNNSMNKRNNIMNRNLPNNNNNHIKQYSSGLCQSHECVKVFLLFKSPCSPSNIYRHSISELDHFQTSKKPPEENLNENLILLSRLEF